MVLYLWKLFILNLLFLFAFTRQVDLKTRPTMLLKKETSRPIFSILLFFWHQGVVRIQVHTNQWYFISSVSQCFFVKCLLSAHNKKHTDIEGEHKQVNYLILTQTGNCQEKDEHFYMSLDLLRLLDYSPHGLEILAWCQN